MNTKPENTPGGGPPGLEYVARVGAALNGAMFGYLGTVNENWRHIRDGSFSFRTAMKTWAQLMESYYAVAVEASRGPGYVREPVWLSFDYSMAQGGTLEATTRIPRPEEGNVTLDKTAFAALGGSSSLDDVYKNCYWDDVGHTTVRVELDTTKLSGSGALGQYISFIFVQGRNSEPPLVVVLLRVRT